MNQPTQLTTSTTQSSSTHPSVLTRSKSRQLPSSRQSLSNPAQPLPKPRRSIVQPLSTSTTNRPIVHLKSTHHSHHGRTKSEIAKVEGMGVRKGPMIVSPTKSLHHQQQQTTTTATMMSGMTRSTSRQNLPSSLDPYHVDFLPSLPSLSPLRPPKRPLSPTPATGAPLQFSSPHESPAKRTHFSPSPSPSTRTSSGPFDLTSPTKSSAGSQSRLMALGGGGSPMKEQGKVRKLLFGSASASGRGGDENSKGAAMDLDHDLTPRHSQFHSQSHSQSHDQGSSSEDELDFLSPRKKLALENARTLKKDTSVSSVGIGSLRSPPRRSVTGGLVRRSSGTKGDEGPKSVPMQRQTFTLPPPPLAMPTTPMLPSYATYQARPTTQALPTTINPSLLTNPTPSGIPRLIRSRSTTIVPPLVPAPTETVNESDLSHNTSTTSTSSVSSGGSEETASRLANLQAMLSRLAMPRHPAGVGKNNSLEIGDGVPGGVEDRKDRDKGTARFREEYEVPLKDDTSVARQSQPLPQKRKLERSKSFGGSGASGSTLTSGGAATGAQRRTSMLPASSSTATIGSMKIEGNKKGILKGVVAYVDVRTSEGDDAGMIFVDMLKSMGARVTVRPSTTLTHIIFKSGRPGTLARYRTIPDASKPFLVGISWVVRCAELEKRVEEKEFLIVENGKNKEVTKELMMKRRRSMEPKAYANLGVSVGSGTSATNADPTVKALIAASIERARRKSLQYAPKVGSPLAKRVFVMPAEEEEDEDDGDIRMS